jgi:murein L,D-transpeptidase YcbB/YkuD
MNLFAACGRVKTDRVVGRIHGERRVDFASIRKIALLTVMFFASSGSRGEAITQVASSHRSSGAEYQYLSVDGQSKMRDLVNSATLSDLRWPRFENYRIEVTEFYDSFGWSLPWVRDSRPTPQALAIITVLRGADLQGLRPDDYDGPYWDAHLSVFQGSRQASEWELARFDVALTVSAMRYLSDLHVGRVNPRLFHFEFDPQGNPIDLSEFVRQRLVDSQDIRADIETVEPPFPAYRRTIDALRNYLELVRHDDGQSLPMPQKSVKMGDAYMGMPRLVKVLQALGDLPTGGSTPGVIFNPLLAEAVRHFQRRHGLDVNGTLDLATVRELNVPLGRRVLQLQLTLERWRWLPHRFERPPIVINIPEFRLHTDDQQFHWVLSLKVVVGRAYRHQTPVFASELKSVIFRPYWNVPISIQRAEVLPHINQDPSYLAKHSYEVVDSKGNVVTSDRTNKEELRSGKLAIRQKPGPENALGLIKFDFPNAHDVYMHGTPATELFSRSRRDFSHGCIRVEDPVALAAWVLRDKTEWTTERIRSAMYDEKTIRVNLDKPIPVVIVYGTAVVMEDREVRFFDDIYGHDAALERVLAQSHP